MKPHPYSRGRYDPLGPSTQLRGDRDLVGARNRLRASGRPRRLFADTKVVAKEAGLMKDAARVVDSTPLYDAVATQDTVTQLRSAIGKVLRLLAGWNLGVRVRLALRRPDSYLTAGKPVLNAEYGLSTSAFCAADNAAGIMGARYDLNLTGATFEPCW